MRAYHHTYGFPTVTTNCSNNYGPYQFPEKLIPLMILNALDGKPLPIYGDGSNVRDWLFVRDHCEGIWAVLCSWASWGNLLHRRKCGKDESAGFGLPLHCIGRTFPDRRFLMLDLRTLSRTVPVMITAMLSISQKFMMSLTGARVLGSRMAFVPLSSGILPIAHGAMPSLPANTNLNASAYHDSTKRNCSGRRIGHSPLSTNHGRQQTAYACL